MPTLPHALQRLSDQYLAPAWSLTAPLAVTHGEGSYLFTGDPVSCAAVLATLQVIEEEGLVENAAARARAELVRRTADQPRASDAPRWLEHSRVAAGVLR